jgi:CubicO group peptidase (beta-lactamase class C family)
VNALEAFLREEIAAGSFPGGTALLGTGESVLESAVAGDAAVEPSTAPASSDTEYDLASLTKPLCGAALLRAAVGEGLSLDAPPGRFFAGWKKTRYDGITLEMLATHTAGLPAWYPLYARGEGVALYRRTLAEIEPDTRPGTSVVYSDIGFLVLTEVLEVFFAAPVDEAFRDLIAAPVGSGAAFLPESPESTAATEKDDATERRMTAERGISYPFFRSGVVRGQVHDGNAFRRGGVSAHAGLFGTAEDVWKLAVPWLAAGARGFVEDRTPGMPEARTLGWQGARGAASAGPEFSARAFGHTGFTGTSVWIDPEPGLVFVLLTNRIHPVAREMDFQEVRRRFHRAARALAD